MPQFIDRNRLRQLVDEEGATVAEVLPAPEYEWAHLPDALHLPLKSWDVAKVEAGLDKQQPVVVYCNDYQ